MSTETKNTQSGAETHRGFGPADDPESAGLRETAGLRGSGSPPDYFGPDARQRDQMAGAGEAALAQAQPQSQALAPFQALNQIRNQMDRLLADLTGLPGPMGGLPSAMTGALQLRPVVWSPPLDISETDEAWTP